MSESSDKALCVCLTAIMLTKSFSPSVSRMVLIVCLAMVIFKPFMLPLMSTMMMMSLGDVAAWMYLNTGHSTHSSITKFGCITIIPSHSKNLGCFQNHPHTLHSAPNSVDAILK